MAVLLKTLRTWSTICWDMVWFVRRVFVHRVKRKGDRVGGSSVKTNNTRFRVISSAKIRKVKVHATKKARYVKGADRWIRSARNYALDYLGSRNTVLFPVYCRYYCGFDLLESHGRCSLRISNNFIISFDPPTIASQSHIGTGRDIRSIGGLRIGAPHFEPISCQ